MEVSVNSEVLIAQGPVQKKRHTFYSKTQVTVRADVLFHARELQKYDATLFDVFFEYFSPLDCP